MLAVDDDPGIRALLRDGLVPLGYRVVLADGVRTARELLRTCPFSLILCDYEMEDGTGLDLISYATRVYPNVPVVLLTAHDETSLARSAIASGAVEFLPKPFEFRHLVRLMEQSWARVERDGLRASQLQDELLSGTIRALVAAVDAKDPYTASHSERVTRLAVRLGETMGLTPERLRVLEFSALLHDVGKIAVPEAVLRKPAKLDPDEWGLIQLHPARSAEIVGQVGPLAEVATIVRHHHERMDGAGYPDGLHGPAIPLLSRIVAITDAYEAMTAHRAYRPALTEIAARTIIEQSLGTHFDAELGVRFLEIADLP